MSLHKLTAGDGYTYLTRQVAAGDSTERGYNSLESYYSGHGEAPGVWMGAGLFGLNTVPGYEVAGEVTEAQMLALFGQGLHPNADAMLVGLVAAGHTEQVALAAGRLGSPFAVFEGTQGWRDRLTAAYEAFNTVRGLNVGAPIPEEDRARIRTDTARELFVAEHGREPIGTGELSGYLAKQARPTSTAVAGYDATFSPVKSFSALWAVAPAGMRESLAAAHDEAVAASLEFLQEEVGYTRRGAAGVRQVRTNGLIMAVFAHRDSRAGDPDLHTHVAISNKVQAADGRWLALDGRMIHRAAVAASEFYNTALETACQKRGLSFADRATVPGKRPVREIVGVNSALSAFWSSRTARIAAHRETLAAAFVAQHGRNPNTVEILKLSQQANLATRQAKHEPRAFADQLDTWREEAIQVLGSEAALDQMITDVTTPPNVTIEHVQLTPTVLTELATEVIDTVSAARSTWTHHHITAEALRQVRYLDQLAPEQKATAAARVTAAALSAEWSIPVGMDAADPSPTPDALLRIDSPGIDGAGPTIDTAYRVANSQRYSSTEVIAAETRIIAAAGTPGARTLAPMDVELAILESAANGRALNTAQQLLVTEVATSGQLVQLAMAPAGSGKTTAMGVLARAWTTTGGTVVGLAPQSSAAQELGESIGGIDADTVDKLVHSARHLPAEQWPGWMQTIDHRTLVIVDEAGLASTRNLDATITFVTGRGGRVLLVGDDQQRAAAGASGVLRDIDTEHGSLTLTEVMRFKDPLEGEMSLSLRAGDPSVAGYYADRGRLHAVTPDTVIDTVYNAWRTDIQAGTDSIMIAPTLDLVAALNTRARADRITDTGQPTGRELTMPNGETVSAGDIIVTKKNNRCLAIGQTDYVRNNYRWRITAINNDRSLSVVLLKRDGSDGAARVLPAAYVDAGLVRLGYAHTEASVQGMTVGSRTTKGTAHAIITPSGNRNSLYPTLTRATDRTDAYVLQGGIGDTHEAITPEAIRPDTITEAFAAIITTDGTPRSSTTEIREGLLPAPRLGIAGDAYADAIVVAAETVIGPQRLEQIQAGAELAVPGVTTAPSWETLAGHLAIIELTRGDAVAELAAAAGRELDSARDLAAVLDYRLDPTGNHSQGRGPLDWLPQIPALLTTNQEWGAYLVAHRTRVEELAAALTEETRTWDTQTAPAWAVPYLTDPALVDDLAHWRAVKRVPETDLRPAGERPTRLTQKAHHAHLIGRAIHIAGDPTDGADRWETILTDAGITGVAQDDFWPVLAARLTQAENAGIDVTTLLHTTLTAGPVPALAPAAAIWWRLVPTLGSITAAPQAGHRLRPGWVTHLEAVLDEHVAERVQGDRLWPVIVAHLDTAIRDGADPAPIITGAAAMLHRTASTVVPADWATTLLWQIHTLTTTGPEEDLPTFPDPEQADLLPPADLDYGPVDDPYTPLPDHEPAPEWEEEEPPFDLVPPAELHLYDYPTPDAEPPFDPELDQAPADPATPVDQVAEPAPATVVEWVPGAQEEPADPTRLPVDAAAVATQPDTDPIGVEADALTVRLFQANAAAHDFFTTHAPHSWVPAYMEGRGLTGAGAGFAPASWTSLVDHLRTEGFTTAEIKAAGLGRTSTRGTLIDAFRDRAMLPITTPDGQIAAFIGRLNPDHTGEAAPKYINTPTTAIFSKTDLPYGINPQTIARLRAGADLVLVEGPMDAQAVETATGGTVVAIAPNGTALTTEHLELLNTIAPLPGRTVYEAFDQDEAGRGAAFRTHTLLAGIGVHHAETVTGLSGKDPAQMLTDNGPQALAAALQQRSPLADVVIDQVINRWPITGEDTVEARIGAMREAATHAAALLPAERARQAGRMADTLRLDPARVIGAIETATPIRTPAAEPTPTGPAGAGPTDLTVDLPSTGGGVATLQRTTTVDAVADITVAPSATQVNELVSTEPVSDTSVDLPHDNPALQPEVDQGTEHEARTAGQEAADIAAEHVIDATAGELGGPVVDVIADVATEYPDAQQPRVYAHVSDADLATTAAHLDAATAQADTLIDAATAEAQAAAANPSMAALNAEANALRDQVNAVVQYQHAQQQVERAQQAMIRTAEEITDVEIELSHLGRFDGRRRSELTTRADELRAKDAQIGAALDLHAGTAGALQRTIGGSDAQARIMARAAKFDADAGARAEQATQADRRRLDEAHTKLRELQDYRQQLTEMAVAVQAETERRAQLTLDEQALQEQQRHQLTQQIGAEAPVAQQTTIDAEYEAEDPAVPASLEDYYGADYHHGGYALDTPDGLDAGIEPD